MRTRVLQVDPAKGPWPELAEFARVVDDGGLVAFPTETVYGIAVNVRDESAVRRLYQAKGRPEAKPLTIHLASADALGPLVREVPRSARKLAARFWPGPLTVVIRDRHGRPTGYRVPDLPVTQEFLRLVSCRVGAPSANPTGGRPAVTAEEVLENFDGVVDAVIDGGRCRHGRSSTVVRVDDAGAVAVLREGVIPEADVREATAKTILFVCTGNRCRSPLAAALCGQLLARRLGCAPDGLLERGYRILSAGTGCILGTPATPEADAVALRHGCDLKQHRSRPLTPSLIEEADAIYVMERGQRATILAFDAEADDRVRLLDRRGREVPDPFRRGSEAYDRAAEMILEALRERLDDF